MNGDRHRPSPRELADRFGTPAYHYELDVVDAAAERLRHALPHPAVRYYSLKANPHPLLAATLRAAGCSAEISSPGELAVAEAAGFDPAGCLYTGPGKSDQEIGAALAAGVRRFSVESAADYHRVSATAAVAGTRAECLVRVNTLRAKGGGGLRMSGAASQFGVDASVLVDHPEAFAARPGGQVVGLHFFSVSNARDEAAIIREALANVASAARLRDRAGIDLRVLDLGGGFAAPYAHAGDLPDYPALRAAVEAGLDEHLPGWRGGDPVVAFESGRYLVGTCGHLVATVADVKRSEGRTFVVLDGGINHLGGLSGIGRLLPMAPTMLPATGQDRRPEPGPTEGRATVVGPLCTPADVLARDAEVGTVAHGDLVAIPNVGAYGLTASLVGFLSRPVAAEVVLRAGHPVHASRLELRRVALHRSDAHLDHPEVQHDMSGSV